MTRIAVLMIVCSLFLISAAGLCAEEPVPSVKPTAGWVTAGYGVPLHGTEAMHFSLVLAGHKDRLFIVRAAGVRQHDLSVTPDQTVRDIGLMVGAFNRPMKGVMIYAAGGLGYAEITRREWFKGWTRNAAGDPVEMEFAQSTLYRAAVAYEAHALYAPLKYAALGLAVFGDINAERSYAAVALSLHLGFLP